MTARFLLILFALASLGCRHNNAAINLSMTDLEAQQSLSEHLYVGMTPEQAKDGLRDAKLTSASGDWEKNLDYLHVLPKRKVVLQFDGRTDIFRAKEIIGDHCCIFGDVPATMLAFGGKDEVSEYCKKLIEVVGKDGGFILAAGCEIAPNARPENVKAMIDAVKQCGYYS